MADYCEWIEGRLGAGLVGIDFLEGVEGVGRLLLEHNDIENLILKCQWFKQDIFFSHSSHLEFDIVFLHETHVTNIVEASKFSKLCGGDLVFWHKKSCGVGILLNKNLSFKLVSHVRDTDGRLLRLYGLQKG